MGALDVNLYKAALAKRRKFLGEVVDNTEGGNVDSKKRRAPPSPGDSDSNEQSPGKRSYTGKGKGKAKATQSTGAKSAGGSGNDVVCIDDSEDSDDSP